MTRRPPPLALCAWLPLALAALAMAPAAAATDAPEPARPQAQAEPVAQPLQLAVHLDNQATGLRRWIAALSPFAGRPAADADRPLTAVLTLQPRSPDTPPSTPSDASAAATIARPAAPPGTATLGPSPDLHRLAAPAPSRIVDLPVLVADAPLPQPSPTPAPERANADTVLALAAVAPAAALALPQLSATAPAAPQPMPAKAMVAAPTESLPAPSAVSDAPRLAAAPAAVLMAAATPRTPAPAAPPEPRFDLSINNAPASQVFLQLANGTAYNMLVSPDVSGTLSITLKDTTVPEAMDTMREMFGFEYRITGNRIFVYPNTVQTRLYRVNYLPGRRQGASDTRITSSAISASGGGGNGNNGGGNNQGGNGGGNNPGGNGLASRADDNAHVRTTNDTDFWREVHWNASLIAAASACAIWLKAS